jgi:hypothetical protein
VEDQDIEHVGMVVLFPKMVRGEDSDHEVYNFLDQGIQEGEVHSDDTHFPSCRTDSKIHDNDHRQKIGCVSQYDVQGAAIEMAYHFVVDV